MAGDLPEVAVGQVKEGLVAPMAPLVDLLTARIDAAHKELSRLRKEGFESQSALKHHLESLMVERDQRYTERFASGQHALDLALASQAKALEVALSAQQKAVEATKQYVDTVTLQTDARYTERFRASEVAVNAALAAQEKAVSAAFAASDRAIVKAEEAQKVYNLQSNNYRGQIEDQQKATMPRTETDTRFRALEDRLGLVQAGFDDKMSTLKSAIEKTTDSIGGDIKILRESRSEVSGRQVRSGEMVSYGIAAASILVSIFIYLLTHPIH